MDKSKASEAALYTVDVLQKMVLGFIPGNHLVDGFLNYRSGLKQNRLINFFDAFKNLLDEHAGHELTSYDFNNEDFVDVMDSIITMVQTTKSDYKLQRFRNILLRQIVTPDENQKTKKVLSILNELTDIQIVILDSISDVTRPSSRIDFRLLLDFYNRPRTHKPHETIHDGYTMVKIGSDEVKVINKEIDFLVSDLISKGLIIKERIEKHTLDRTYIHQAMSNKSTGTVPVETYFDAKYMLSSFGSDFLKLITDL